MTTRTILKGIGGFSILAGLDAIVLVLCIDSVVGKIIYAVIGAFSISFGVLVLALMPPRAGRPS